MPLLIEEGGSHGGIGPLVWGQSEQECLSWVGVTLSPRYLGLFVFDLKHNGFMQIAYSVFLILETITFSPKAILKNTHIFPWTV